MDGIIVTKTKDLFKKINILIIIFMKVNMIYNLINIKILRMEIQQMIWIRWEEDYNSKNCLFSYRTLIIILIRWIDSRGDFINKIYIEIKLKKEIKERKLI